MYVGKAGLKKKQKSKNKKHVGWFALPLPIFQTLLQPAEVRNHLLFMAALWFRDVAGGPATVPTDESEKLFYIVTA